MSWLVRSSLCFVFALLIACAGDDPTDSSNPEDVTADLTADGSGDVASDDVIVEPDLTSDGGVEEDASDVEEDGASDVATEVTPSLSCDAFAACEASVIEGCAMIRDAADSYGCEAACLEAATTCEEATGCLPEDDSVITPFDDGPSGLVPRDLAGDFTLPTLDGDFVFSESWNGRDSYLFLLTQQAFTYSTSLWASPIYQWLQQSPKNIHVFFLSYQEADGTDMAQEVVTQMKTQVEEGIDKIGLVYGAGAACKWKRRMHYVPVMVWNVGGWIPQHLDLQSGYGFAIDRHQKVRNVGMLHVLGNGDAQPQLSHLMYENQFFNFEHQRELDLVKEGVTEVMMVEKTNTGGGTYEVEFPDAQTMAQFDTMEIDLTSNCEGHFEGSGCPEWDYKAWIELRETMDENLDTETACQPKVNEVIAVEEVMGACSDDVEGACMTDADCAGEGAVCEGYIAPVEPVSPIEADTLPCTCYAYDETPRESAQTCNGDGLGYGDCSCGEAWEFGRWITSYGREGRWVHDVSPMLAFFKTGGVKRMRYKAGNTYLTTLKFRLYNQGKGMRPVRVTKLFGGGGYANSYNAKYEPMPITISEDTKRVEVVAHITGHGFGSEAENCAEFCNHTHHFGVNGTDYVKEHEEAGWMYGCAMQVVDGTIPNQYGTWYLGRGGWCPGFQVDPYVADVTADITVGAQNSFTYKSLLNGKDYVATPGSGGGGFGSSIWMTSWMVEWE